MVLRTSVLLMWLSLIIACDEGGSGIPVIPTGGNGDGSLVVGLVADGAMSASLSKSVAAFNVRLFETPPSSLDKKPYFQSGCVPFNSFFELSNLPVGNRWVVAFDGYSSDTCAEGSAVAFGLRGEVQVVKKAAGDTSNGPYHYVQVNEKGAFTPFPLPGPELNPVHGGVTCTSDDVCKTQVHPAARCTGGVCRLSSLFPLNTRERRAFHSAVEVSDRVVLVGGHNAASAGQVEVRQPGTETFDPSSGLFGAEPVANLSNEHAFAPAVVLEEDHKVVLLGGVPKMGMVKAKEGWLPAMTPQACTGPDKCNIGLSNLANVWSVDSGSAVASPLPYSGAGGCAAAVVAPDGGIGVLVRPGLVQTAKGSVEYGTKAYLCRLDESDVLACDEVKGAGAARGLSTGVCFTEGPGACLDYLILGGGPSGKDGANFAEVYTAGDGTIHRLLSTGALPKALIGAVAVKVAGAIYTFGGVDDSGAGVGPLKIVVDPAAGKAAVTQVQVGKDVDSLLRVLHQVTPLADTSRVLVTGGLGKDWQPLDTAVVLSISSDGVVKVEANLRLSVARLGHAATLVTRGLLKGMVLVTGGFQSLGDTASFADGAEVFLP